MASFTFLALLVVIEADAGADVEEEEDPDGLVSAEEGGAAMGDEAGADAMGLVPLPLDAIGRAEVGGTGVPAVGRATGLGLTYPMDMLIEKLMDDVPRSKSSRKLLQREMRNTLEVERKGHVGRNRKTTPMLGSTYTWLSSSNKDR